MIWTDEMGTALARVEEGKDGPNQRSSVRRYLSKLEAEGAIEYRDGGWYKTAKAAILLKKYGVSFSKL
jgi:hypothetical protein